MWIFLLIVVAVAAILACKYGLSYEVSVEREIREREDNR